MTGGNLKTTALEAGNASFLVYSKKDPGEIYNDLKTSGEGLSHQEAKERLEIYGANTLASEGKMGVLRKLLSQFLSPLVVLLAIVATLSFFFGSIASAVIIILMALLSIFLSFVQENNASKNAERLQAMVKITASVKREGKTAVIPLKDLVPGDIIELSAGKMVPADIKILSATDLYVNQSALNGESFPVKKDLQSLPERQTHRDIFSEPSLAFMGSNVVGGFAEAIVLRTGKNTEFGKLSKEISQSKTETGFDKGLKSFTWLMIRLIVILCLAIFLINAALKGNYIDALLFSLAVAIGLAPEMLPMIVTVNLSKGALDMAKKKVIIKELDSIQNFGAMDILCTDKTGTLTLDNVVLVKHCDIDGKEEEKIAHFAYLNSFFQSGMQNILDKAVISHHKFETSSWRKVYEIPFDFERRTTSVIIQEKDDIILITKGAPEAILQDSTHYYKDGDINKLDRYKIEKYKAHYDSFSKEGFRVLGVAYKRVDKQKIYGKEDENELIFLGFIAFLDPPKPTAQKAILELEKLGIGLKVLSGDNELVTRKICQEVKIDITRLLNGDRVEKMTDKELGIAVEKANVFCRLSPIDKERVLKALQKNGHVVGFLGDGINDSPSLKVSDVGISVDNATDIAKDTAQIILLQKDLSVLSECVKEGRKTFANVIKYIKMGASSNFGNMISMTGASLFLPFLPMLPMQILLNNFLYDFSQAAIPTDDVDDDYLLTPRPWNINFIKKFVIYIGPLSSIFDFATFAIMWYFFRATPELFHTGWFVESLTTQILIVHIIRTNKIPFIQSKPSKILSLSTLIIVFVGFVLPYLPFAKTLGFAPLPGIFFLILLFISVTYLLLVQLCKGWFIKRFGYE